ncbi:hypothetical protein NMY22_g255 [Coprinellus aureogranulatus]|nr:hypothetical protein NMY22_g255 [Coprinellus aureogranulatus]
MDPENTENAPVDLSRFTDEERDLLTNYEREKRDLESEKAVLLEKLKATEEKIINAQRCYGEIFNARSGISVLPNEILSTIFHELQRMNRVNGFVENPIAEVTVTHVCSLWRHIGLSQQSLWTVFRYDGDSAPCIPLDRLQAYLERSQTLPMEYWFKFSGFKDDDAGEWDMFDAIVPHFYRCKTLHMLTDTVAPNNDLVEKLKHASLPMLEYLTVCPGRMQESLNEQVMFSWDANTLLEGAARPLKYLRLDSTSTFDFRPPLSLLVHLRMEAIPGTDAVSKLSLSVLLEIFAFPLLESLSIWGDFFFISETEYANGVIVNANRLKHCRLEARKGYTMHYFLSHVVAPALETLTLAIIRLDIPLILHDNIDQFPSLHTLSLLRGARGFRPDTLADFMSLMTVTRHIKRFVLASPLMQFLPGSMAPPPESGLAARATQIWTEVQEVSINVDTRALELSYKPLIVAFPKLKRLGVNESCKENMAGDAGWAELQERMKFEITAFPEDELLIPFHWSGGPDWIDTDQDPYVAMSSLYMGP